MRRSAGGGGTAEPRGATTRMVWLRDFPDDVAWQRSGYHPQSVRRPRRRSDFRDSVFLFTEAQPFPIRSDPIRSDPIRFASISSR